LRTGLGIEKPPDLREIRRLEKEARKKGGQTKEMGASPV